LIDHHHHHLRNSIYPKHFEVEGERYAVALTSEIKEFLLVFPFRNLTPEKCDKIENKNITMKVAAILALIGSAAAFAPSAVSKVRR
jgi:hypothetical protein